MVLESSADKEYLIKALQDFQMYVSILIAKLLTYNLIYTRTMVVEELIDKLRGILDAPNKRILYKYIRLDCYLVSRVGLIRNKPKKCTVLVTRIIIIFLLVHLFHLVSELNTNLSFLIFLGE